LRGSILGKNNFEALSLGIEKELRRSEYLKRRVADHFDLGVAQKLGMREQLLTVIERRLKPELEHVRDRDKRLGSLLCAASWGK